MAGRLPLLLVRLQATIERCAISVFRFSYSFNFNTHGTLMPSKKYLKYVPENTVGRDFVVGDIHGYYDELMTELEKVSFDKTKDRLFSVGDLVDRGPKNLEVLRLIKEPWFHSVIGNHEDMMIQHLVGESHCRVRTWMPNGGRWYNNLSAQDQIEVETLAEHMYNTTPVGIEIVRKDSRIGIIHAAPPTDWSELGFIREVTTVMWDRDHLYDVLRKRILNTGPNGYPNKIYMGHTPMDNVVESGIYTWVDTGVFYSGVLTVKEI